MIGKWKSLHGSIWSRPTVYLSKEDNQRKSARVCARGYEENQTLGQTVLHFPEKVLSQLI